MAKGKHVMKVD